MVDFLEYDASSVNTCQKRALKRRVTIVALLEASVAMRSKISLTNEFKMAIALLEIPVSG